MRIAYLLGSLNRGGTETLLLDVFRNAAKNNLDAIGLYRKSGTLETEFSKSGIQLHKIPTGNILHYILQLRKHLTGNEIQLVHAQQPIDALFAMLACLGTRIKLILTFHGYDFNDGKVGSWILRFTIKRTNGNIFVSDAQRKYYQQKYRLNQDRQQVVYNGISFDKLDNSTASATTHSRNNSADARCIQASVSLRDEFKLAKDTLLLGSVGNFVSGRDQLTLCRFLRRLNQQQLDFHFVFVGIRSDSSTQLFDECSIYCEQNELLDRVSFLGSRNDVPFILQQLDAFLYSTVHDTFGIAVVEAMAVGIPVFVNDWDVMKEITGNGKYATLYKTKDEIDLLREFMLFLQNKDRYKAKAKEAARFVREHFSIEKHIEELKKVYYNMINADYK